MMAYYGTADVAVDQVVLSRVYNCEHCSALSSHCTPLAGHLGRIRLQGGSCDSYTGLLSVMWLITVGAALNTNEMQVHH